MQNPLATPKSTLALLKDAAAQWSEDNALRLSAALAYYSIFSIAPLLVIAMAMAGWFFGRDAAHGLLNEQLRGLLGEHAAVGIEGMVQSASQPSTSLFAGIVGMVTLLIGASGVFGELKDALNTIWEVKAKPGQGIMRYVRDRILSFSMVLVIGFLLLISLFLETALAAVTKFLGSALPFSGTFVAVAGFLISFGVITVLFAAIFKLLPDAKVRWHEVWIGAAVTGLLFEIGKFLLGYYLGRESTTSAYGAAASAVLLLLWVYYASLILLFGAEFTRAYARATGATIEPGRNAVAVTLEGRAQEGLSTNFARRAGLPMPTFPEPARESPREVLGIPLSEMEKESGPEPELTFGSFVRDNPVGILLGAVVGGFGVGVILRHFEDAPALSPAQHLRIGARALALAGAAAGATYLSRGLTKTRETVQPGMLSFSEGITKAARKFIETKIQKLIYHGSAG